MKYIVIGLGNFGAELAIRLTQMGHEVIGADVDTQRCNALKDNVSGILCMDASQSDSITGLPLEQADMVIVTIGRHFGASVQTVAQLKRHGVKRIIARGFNEVHIGVLQTLGVERVLFTEKEGAERLAQSLTYGDFISSYRVDAEHYIMEFVAPKQIVGLAIQENTMWRDYNLKTIAIKQVHKNRNALGLTYNQYQVLEQIGPQTIIDPGDVLVVYGTIKAYDAFIRSL